MNRAGALWLLASVTVAATAASVLLPGARELVLVAAVTFLFATSAVAAVVAAWRARPATPSPFGSLLPAAPAPARPDDLVRLEQVLGWKVYSRAEFDVRVAPVLARVLAERVKRRFGVDVAAAPERARALLDPDLWALVDPKPLDPAASSVRTSDISSLVDLIEAL